MSQSAYHSVDTEQSPRSGSHAGPHLFSCWSSLVLMLVVEGVPVRVRRSDQLVNLLRVGLDRGVLFHLLPCLTLLLRTPLHVVPTRQGAYIVISGRERAGDWPHTTLSLTEAILAAVEWISLHGIEEASSPYTCELQ